MTENFVGYHGNRGMLWIEEIENILQFQAGNDQSIRLITKTGTVYSLSNISQVTIIQQLLNTVLSTKLSSLQYSPKNPPKDNKSIQQFLSQNTSCPSWNSFQLLASERILHWNHSLKTLCKAQQSSRALRLTLSSMNCYNIQISKWSSEGKVLRRRVRYNRAFLHWKKQMECTIFTI